MSKPRAAMASGDHTDIRTRNRPTTPTLFRRIAAAFASLALGGGLALVAVATPASAHHNDIEGVTACNTAGTYDITWTVKNSEHLTEEITVSSNPTVVPVGTEIGGKKSATFQQNGVDAGTYELSLGAKWSNGQTNTSHGSVTAEGDCGDGDNEVKKVTYCHATSSATNPYERLTTSVNAFLQSGHIDHDGDIFPAFTYVKNGTTHNIAAQGDQSLLEFDDCAEPDEEIPVGAAPSFSDACGPDNEQLTVPADTPKVDWSTTEVDGTHTVTATAKAGYVFAPGSTTTWEFTVDDAPCVIDVDGAPSFSDACGPDNEQLTVPADTDAIEWASAEADGIVTVTATAKPGSAFPDGAQVEWVYSIDDEPCPESTTPTPADTTPTTSTATTPTGDTLASTGFTGTTISIAAGVLLAAGLAFVVIAQVRRKRA
ncbi:MAG: LPXTG cell wall anchor domain-containing protein [Actinomycetota bacterium]|nr:LPXTG cell wall anchor domain-containing protein [Actinomycetota bacterium]